MACLNGQINAQINLQVNNNVETIHQPCISHVHVLVVVHFAHGRGILRLWEVRSYNDLSYLCSQHYHIATHTSVYNILKVREINKQTYVPQ